MMTLLTVVAVVPLTVLGLMALAFAIYVVIAPALQWRQERKGWAAITRTREAARLTRQCREQDAWYLANDPRGIYGRHYRDVEGNKPPG